MCLFVGRLLSCCAGFGGEVVVFLGVSSVVIVMSWFLGVSLEVIVDNCLVVFFVLGAEGYCRSGRSVKSGNWLLVNCGFQFSFLYIKCFCLFFWS